jgi:hypothetical protein
MKNDRLIGTKSVALTPMVSAVVSRQHGQRFSRHDFEAVHTTDLSKYVAEGKTQQKRGLHVHHKLSWAGIVVVSESREIAGAET